MKRSISLPLLTLAAVALAVSAFAQGPRWGQARTDEAERPRQGQRLQAADGLRGQHSPHGGERLQPQRRISQQARDGQDGRNPAALREHKQMRLGAGPMAGHGGGPRDGTRPSLNNPHPFWRFEALRDKIELTDDQVARLDARLAETRANLIEHKAAFERKRLALDETVRTNNEDIASIERAIEELGVARTETQKTLATHRHAVQQILTPEQHDQLKALRAKAGWAQRAGDHARTLSPAQRENIRQRGQSMPEERRQRIQERFPEAGERFGRRAPARDIPG